MIDWLILAACLTGPVKPTDTGWSANVSRDATLDVFARGAERTRVCLDCRCTDCLAVFDTDGDGDVDLVDVAVLQHN